MSDAPKGFFPVNQEEMNKSGSSVFFLLKEGTTQLRILPPYSSRGSWFREVKEHKSRLNGEFASATCPSSAGKPCIFCDTGRKLYHMGDEKSVKLAKTYRPIQAFLFNTFVYSSPQNIDLTRGVLVLKSGIKVKRQLMDLDQDAAGGWGDITNLEKGFDIRVTRKGKDVSTEYYVKGVPSRNSILESLKKQNIPTEFSPHDLDKLLALRPQAELEQMFEEFDSNAQAAPGFESAPVKSAEAPVGDDIPSSPVVSENLINVAPPTE